MGHDRAAVRRLLLANRRKAELHITNIREAKQLRYPFLHEELYQYVLAKFHLTDEDRPADDSFNELTERSLAKSMQISPDLVAEFDTAQSCDGATSVMAKKVLLYMSIQRALEIELPATESARVKTMSDVSKMVWNTLASSPAWKDRLQD